MRGFDPSAVVSVEIVQKVGNSINGGTALFIYLYAASVVPFSL
jgi:hypothetical protein